MSDKTNAQSTPEAVQSVVLTPECVDKTQDTEVLAASVQSLGLNQIQRHIFICADQTLPQCSSKETGLEAWNYLKKRLKELNLEKPTESRPLFIFRTKANCLRVCNFGPIVVIYPDGVWYRRATPEVIERIIQEHLMGNTVVQEYAFLIQPLPKLSNFDPADKISVATSEGFVPKPLR